eukprot:2809225-Rhodomonas_salina.2
MEEAGRKQCVMASPLPLLVPVATALVNVVIEFFLYDSDEDADDDGDMDCDDDGEEEAKAMDGEEDECIAVLCAKLRLAASNFTKKRASHRKHMLPHNWQESSVNKALGYRNNISERNKFKKYFRMLPEQFD